MKLQLLSTSDTHGFWWDDDFIKKGQIRSDGLLRAASAMAVVDSLAQAQGDWVLKIENGDFIQGSPLTTYIAECATDQANLFETIPKAIGYDVRVLGNHEFNYGRDYLTNIFKNDKTLLNANILDSTTGQPFIGQPFKIFEKKGYRVAIIGLTTKAIPRWEKPENITNLHFADPVLIARRLVTELASQVDEIVLAYHGGFSRDLVNNQILEEETGENQGNELLNISGVSAIITGHQHRLIANTYQQIPISQPGYRAEAIGQLTLDLGHIEPAQSRLIKTANWPANAQLSKKLTHIRTELDNWLDQPIGQLATDIVLTDVAQVRRTGHPFVDLINQVQLAATGADLAATALFNDEMPGFHKIVTRRQLLANYPFPNTLVTVAMTGKQIKEALEVNAGYFTLENGEIKVSDRYHFPKQEDYNYDLWAGLNYEFHLNHSLGERVTVNSIRGLPFNPSKTYSVAINNYRATGAGNPIFAQGKVLHRGKIPLTRLIQNYLQQHPDLVLKTKKHFKIQS
ncbi:bifunctional metallophosphatase/5'-nucleotidase [Convivina intestini]|uniref:2',3'-cyclic-nucleotide 2'-phosphodiesterase/3'-nucleotidase n=1 Tax=Convivina intestini TaxID=1505726 RepID=A0A2U1DF30_9LACO|nr:bifunctional UDP-sugar hydrolase/5'-nucleotidase [Convivina intestini]PVY86274.1 2',3'-cyclic-nucleotide 2'-phosphodiesterase/3'-nucleotidase [Convivina intestini]CAH1851098.1 2',3'-cyclic-nucleotide 2'-phosphodiesterase/3'-nucleotidase [Convivina intestini]SDB82076.1 2',3'-cyclic-nucleotide 2'-phosphodiesterase / 3'-nucleotidase [Leuconostocaceae bacterium R-53105]